MIKLNLDGIIDIETKNVLESLIKEVNSHFVLKGKWQFMEINFKQITGDVVAHNLGVKPVDLIVLSSTAGTISISNQSITKVTITPTSIGTARILIGAYKED